MIITTEIADKVVERGVQTMYSTGDYRQRDVLSKCEESLSPEICHSAIPNEGVRSKKKDSFIRFIHLCFIVAISLCLAPSLDASPFALLGHIFIFPFLFCA